MLGELAMRCLAFDWEYIYPPGRLRRAFVDWGLELCFFASGIFLDISVMMGEWDYENVLGHGWCYRVMVA